MLMIIVLVIAGVFVIGIALVIVEVLRRLFWLTLRLLASATVALVAAISAMGLASPGEEWIAAPVALVLAMLTFWVTRGWTGDRAGPSAQIVADVAPGRRDVHAGAVRTAVRASGGVAPERTAVDAAACHSANARSLRATPLIDGALCQRLAATEEELDRAARDDLGTPAAEWLTFWRRRVPDLIAAAQGVYDDAGDMEKAEVAAHLAEHLDNIVAEADRRLAIVRAARRDLFTTRGNHAEGRIRDG